MIHFHQKIYELLLLLSIESWNHKRVHRIYCLLKLNFRRKGKQRLPVRNPAPLATPQALNQSWSIDFMHDALVCGRRFRTFNVVDDFNREALAIEIDLNIPAQRVIRVLDRMSALPADLRITTELVIGTMRKHGYPAGLRRVLLIQPNIRTERSCSALPRITALAVEQQGMNPLMHRKSTGDG
jgi:transposase InsO family protein